MIIIAETKSCTQVQVTSQIKKNADSILNGFKSKWSTEH